MGARRRSCLIKSAKTLIAQDALVDPVLSPEGPKDTGKHDNNKDHVNIPRHINFRPMYDQFAMAVACLLASRDGRALTVLLDKPGHKLDRILVATTERTAR